MKQTVVLRQEQASDFEAVFEVIRRAFEKEEYSDQREQYLVERLRNSSAFIPELSIVAETEGKVVGHILMTKIQIKDKDATHPSLALAPVSVLPEFQGKGIGARLIHKAHEVADSLGFSSSVLLGHEKYYPRFGYERTDKYNIRLPFPAPPENCMVKSLRAGGLEGVEGMVEYAEEFFE